MGERRGYPNRPGPTTDEAAIDLLPHDFYARDALAVARDLLGKHLVRDSVVLRITEVEAYCWPDDTACHASRGRTPRTEVMFGPGGHAYVYLCYGIHNLVNVVVRDEGEGAGVLIRSCEPVSGLDVVRERRGGRRGPALLTGPGKVGQALGVDASWRGHAYFEAGGLEIRDGEGIDEIIVGPRVGIDYALPEHRDAPWRLAVANSNWVSQRRGLGPDER